MDYSIIEPRTSRLSLFISEREWRQTTIAQIPISDARLTAVAESLRSTIGSDEVQLAQFTIEAAALEVQWALRSGQWIELGILGRFFAHPIVAAALPAVSNAGPEIADFQHEGVFMSYGRLASCIFGGGPYVSFPGSPEDALNMARDFMSAACEKGFSWTSAWTNQKSWTDWFFGYGLDASFLWFNLRTGTMTVLLVTGAD
jgi:hypothetical protein